MTQAIAWLKEPIPVANGGWVSVVVATVTGGSADHGSMVCALDGGGTLVIYPHATIIADNVDPYLFVVDGVEVSDIRVPE
jgi:hypothetical protein